MKEQRTSSSSTWASDESLQNESRPCIEDLQHVVVELLMKNEALRFELFAVRQQLTYIERRALGACPDEFQTGLAPHLLEVLTELCHCGTVPNTDATPA